MAELPSGTVTFLFTDVEGSTRLLQRLGRDRYEQLLSTQQELLTAAFAAHQGRVVDTQGDSFFVAFQTAADAVAAAVDAQRDLSAHEWPDGAEVKVRMGLHTGEPKVGQERYVGVGVHRAARIGAAGHGGQVLLSTTTKELAEEELPTGATIRDLGQRRLKDIDQPQRLYQLDIDGLPNNFAPLKTLDVELRRKRRRMYAGSALIGVLAAAIAIPLFALGQNGLSPGKRLAAVDANAVGVIDTANNTITSEIPVGTNPGGITVGDDAIWVTNADDHTVSRIDLHTGTLSQTIPVASEPSGITAGDGAIWVANSLGNTVFRIDPKTNTVVDEITVGNSPRALAYGFRSVWVANAGDATVSRIDPASDTVTKTFGVGAGVSGIAAGDGALWVTSDAGSRLYKIDPHSYDILQTIGVGNGPGAVALTPNAVWVANEPDGTVSRIEPVTGTVKAAVQVGDGPSAIAANNHTVWVSNQDAGSLTRIDPSSGTVIRTLKTGSRPAGLALAGDSLFVAMRSATAAAHRGGTLTALWDFRANPAQTVLRGLDPGVTPAGGGMYPTLVGYKATGGSSELVANLAAVLPTPTDAGTTYRFQLRRVPYWTGHLVRPADFRYALERIFKLGSYWAVAYLNGIVGARACAKNAESCDLSRGVVADDRHNTVTFHLLAPDPDFLYKVAYLAPVPAGTPLKLSPRQWPPSTGPYMVSTITADRATLVRNPRFRVWSPAARPDGYPDRLIFGNEPVVAGVKAVLAGKADIAEALELPSSSPALFRQLETRFPSQIRANPILATIFFFLNTRVPPFDDVRVRRAVNYAFDRAEAVRLAGGPKVSHLTCQILPLAMPGYQPYCPYTLNRDRVGTWTAPDLAKAKRLIAASGTKGMRVVVYDCHTACAGHEAGRYFVSLLHRLGYRAQLRVLGDKIYWPTIWDSRRKVQAAAHGWSTDYPAPSGFIPADMSCAAFHARDPGNQNDSEFCDHRIDAQMVRATALQLGDPVAANELWARIDREITDKAPWLAFSNPQAIDVISKRVGNYQYTPLGALRDQMWVR
jgi:YVTN family beta-propeller protein